MIARVRADEAQPSNGAVLKYLKSKSTPKGQGGSPFEAGAYRGHTHPDLEEWFYGLGKGLPEDCVGAAYGYPVLVRPDVGVIFALATGTSTVLVRLPRQAHIDAIVAGATVEKSYSTGEKLEAAAFGEDWLIFDAWALSDAQMQEWLKQAYAYSGELVPEAGGEAEA